MTAVPRHAAREHHDSAVDSRLTRHQQHLSILGEVLDRATQRAATRELAHSTTEHRVAFSSHGPFFFSVLAINCLGHIGKTAKQLAALANSYPQCQAMILLYPVIDEWSLLRKGVKASKKKESHNGRSKRTGCVFGNSKREQRAFVRLCICACFFPV
jgi:hypothetical protein